MKNTVDFLNILFETNGTALHCLLTNVVPINDIYTPNIIHSESKVLTDISCDAEKTLTVLDLINNILVFNKLDQIELDWDRFDEEKPMLKGFKIKDNTGE